MAMESVRKNIGGWTLTNSMIIKKKCWPEMFSDILNGKKNFDVRLNDFECKEGDVLVLEEFNPKTKKYTGRKIEKKIKYILKTKEQKFWSADEINEKGFVVLGLD